MTIIDTLKSSELFGGLEADHLKKVSVLCRGGSYQPGMMVFKEGDEATEFYVLTDGRLALEMEVRPVPNRPAIPTAVEVVTEGESFGWSALIEPHVYTLSARCMTNCRVLTIKGDMLHKVMADDAGLGFELMKRLAQLIARRLVHTRLRLTSGLGLVLLGKELGASE
ncbi:MAG TPA: cyclic nucleotide-binding domain-containing protein [Dehalococcoidia bacterium]|nr:cyclic nucleotide-binding domain-containing protein [Dehalococcoidia bacterium]